MVGMREVRGSSGSQTPGRRDRRHSVVRYWLPVLLVVALLGAAVASYRFELGERYLPGLAADPVTEPEEVLPPAGLDLPAWNAPNVTPAATTAGTIDPGRVRALLRRAVRDRDLGPHAVAAVGHLSGAGQDWTSGDGTFLPASTTKLLTATAALGSLGPDKRFVTRVTTGRSPREVVLVGGGDPLLASAPAAPDEEPWPARADVRTLARDTADALGPGARVRVRYDDSLFAGPSVNPHWRADYVPDDVVSPITAPMVDAGREAPDDYRRVDDPSLAAAVAFADGLASAGVRVLGAPRPGAVPTGADDLAAVESAPLADLAEHLLVVSDNEASEVLAHHVGLSVVGEGSFEAGAAATLSTLAALGVPTEGALLHDGSGLSRDNRLTTALVLGVLRAAAGPGNERLRSVLTGLPVAGFTGSLTYRFDEGAPLARGLVRAKTGTLGGVSSLAGLATGRDGTPMVFVLAADRIAEADEEDAEDAIDRLAGLLATCRCGGTPG